MRNLGRAIFVAALVLMSASWAWSAVTISWTDAVGPHTQNLENVDNPNYDSEDPLNIEDPYVWFDVCNVAMSQSSMPIQFDVVGNFLGELGLLWPQVRIEEHVTNLTSIYKWDTFNIDIVDEDGEVYVNAMIEPNWSVTTDLLYAEFTADGSAYYIMPNEVFDDTQHFYAMVLDPEEGSGTLTFTKQASGVLVPEAGSIAALLSGVMGVFACYKKRRRD